MGNCVRDSDVSRPDECRNERSQKPLERACPYADTERMEGHVTDEAITGAAEGPHEAADTRIPGLLEATWRYRRMSAVIVAVGLLAGLGVSLYLNKGRPQSYVATARLALTDPRGSNVFRQGSSAGSDLVRYVGERAAFAESDDVLALAAQALGPGFSSRQLRDQITTSEVQEQNLIAVSATSGDRDAAVRIANAVTEAYREASEMETRLAADEAMTGVVLAKERLLSTLRSADSATSTPSAAVERSAGTQALAVLEQRASEVAINASLFGDGVNFSDPAQSARPVSATSTRRNVAAAGLLSFLLAVALSWVRADRYQTADDSDLPAAALDAPVLGQVPELRTYIEKLPLRRVTSMPADPYQFVASALQSAMTSGALLITSATESEGKTVTAANLAVAAALQGRRVVLIDADSDARGLTTLMAAAGVPKTMPGLVDLALGEADLDAGIAAVPLKHSAELSFIPAGRSTDDVASLYRGEGTTKILRRLRTEYELLIIDGPALFDGAEAASFIPHSDGILMIVRRGTPIKLLASARKRLDLFDVELFGYVFTHSRRSSGSAGVGRFRPSTRKDSRRRTTTP